MHAFFILFTNTILNLSGFEMLTVGTAKVHWLYFDYIYILVPVVRPQLVQSLSSEVICHPLLIGQLPGSPSHCQ